MSAVHEEPSRVGALSGGPRLPPALSGWNPLPNVVASQAEAGWLYLVLRVYGRHLPRPHQVTLVYLKP
jgi:hypothetical protein